MSAFWSQLPIRYVTGARLGVKRKKTVSQTENCLRKMNFVQEKQTRVYMEPKQQQNRPWLAYNSKTNMMTCSLCIKFKKHVSTKNIEDNKNTPKKYSFISGCDL